jgi:muramoyltetrapeptide carboxypeptidase
VNRHIYIFSPSSAVRDKPAFRRGVARLTTLGYDVEVDAAALASHQRFAGPDDERIAAISRAAASGARIALISRGGYGLTRILPGIAYRSVARAIERGTQFVGLSDFTALQSALVARTGAVTWAGPAVGEDFGREEGPDDIMEACFDDLVLGQGEGTGWQLPRSDVVALAARRKAPVDPEAPVRFSVRNATLWGGNLTVLCSLLGTPYWPQIDGGVLFVEDVHEHPYRIERTLTQLLHAGVLARQKAVVLGQFSNYRLVPHDRGFKLQTVVDWLRTQVRTPILTQLPFGHVPTKVLLPVGAPVTLSVEGRDVFMVWGHRH